MTAAAVEALTTERQRAIGKMPGVVGAAPGKGVSHAADGSEVRVVAI